MEKEACQGAKVEKASQPDRTEAALTALIDEITAAQPDNVYHPLILVLDKYHVIEIEAIYAGLTFLSNYLPPEGDHTKMGRQGG